MEGLNKSENKQEKKEGNEILKIKESYLVHGDNPIKVSQGEIKKIYVMEDGKVYAELESAFVGNDGSYIPSTSLHLLSELKIDNNYNLYSEDDGPRTGIFKNLAPDEQKEAIKKKNEEITAKRNEEIEKEQEVLNKFKSQFGL